MNRIYQLASNSVSFVRSACGGLGGMGREFREYRQQDWTVTDVSEIIKWPCAIEHFFSAIEEAAIFFNLMNAKSGASIFVAEAGEYKLDGLKGAQSGPAQQARLAKLVWSRFSFQLKEIKKVTLFWETSRAQK